LFQNKRHCRQLFADVYLEYIGDYVPKEFSADEKEEIRWLVLDSIAEAYVRNKPRGKRKKAFVDIVDSVKASWPPPKKVDIPYSKKKKVVCNTVSLRTYNPYSPLEDEVTECDLVNLDDWAVDTAESSDVEEEILSDNVKKKFRANNPDGNDPDMVAAIEDITRGRKPEGVPDFLFEATPRVRRSSPYMPPLESLPQRSYTDYVVDAQKVIAATQWYGPGGAPVRSWFNAVPQKASAPKGPMIFTKQGGLRYKSTGELVNPPIIPDDDEFREGS